MNTNAMLRPDFAAIANWVKPGARILDLGCGDGSLLRYLSEQRGGAGYGLKIDDEGILACARNGVNVIQGDLERGLSGFADRSFDTPNIHLCTITDFEDFCRGHGVRILERIVMRDGSAVSLLPNLLGS